MQFDDKQFVETWLEAHRNGDNQTWVAEKLGVSRQRVSNKAMYLRKKGVRLPKLSRLYSWGLSVTEVDELNALIENEEQKTV